MWITFTIYTWLIVCIAVFCFTTACLVVFNILGRKIVAPETRKVFNKRVLRLWGASLGLGLGLCGLAQMLGVGPMIFVSIRNRFLHGFKGCPCQPVKPINFPKSILNSSTHAKEYRVHMHYENKIKVFTCVLDKLTQAYPEWHSRPHRYYSYDDMGHAIQQYKDDVVDGILDLNIGYGEKPLLYKQPKMVWPVYYYADPKRGTTTTKDEMRKIPKDQPTVFVGDWPKELMEEYRKIKGTTQVQKNKKTKKRKNEKK